MTVDHKSQVITDFFNTPTNSIRKYIPDNKLVRPFIAFRLLVVINVYPANTKFSLKKIYCTNDLTINKSINRLLELGLIYEHGKSYFVTAINKFRVYTVYSITPKGKKALLELL